MVVAPQLVERESEGAAAPSPPKEHDGRRLRLNGRARAVAVGTVLLIFGQGLLVVGQAARLNARGYELARNRVEVAELAQQNHRLELEIAQLSSPQHLAAVAQGQLGLAQPDDRHVAYLPLPETNPAQVAAATPSEAPRPDLFQTLAQAVRGWQGMATR